MAFIWQLENMNPSLEPTNMNNSTNFTLDQLITKIPQSGMLYTLPVFDSIFEKVPSENITRRTTTQVNNLIGINMDMDEIFDLMTDNESESEDEDLYQSPSLIVPNCHVIGMLPFSQVLSTNTSLMAAEHASAIALALQHLNTGNSSIVNSLGDLRESMCSELTFTLEFIDTKDNPGVAIDEVFNVTERTIENNGYRTPCSFIGATRSAVSIPAALVTGHKGYMELSGSSTGFQLDDRLQYPNFGRTIPPDTQNVIPIMNYFVDVLELKYLAVISMNEAYGNSFVESLQIAKDDTIGAPTIYRITIDSSGDGITQALKDLKKSEYRYILAAMPNMDNYDRLLTAAYDMGLAGNGTHQWYFSDSFGGHRDIDTMSEALQLSYNRTGVFKPSAGRHNQYNEFVYQLERLSRSKEDMEYVHNVIPQNNDSQEKLSEFFNSFENNNNGNSNNIANITNTTYDFSQVLNTHDSAAFIYDATIAMGISACLAIGLKNDGTYFSGPAQFNILKDLTTFHGATGNVIFNNRTGSRTMNSTYYKLFNYVDEELTNEKTGKKIIRFVMNTASIYEEGVWLDGENVTEKAFVYTDGNYNQPRELPPPSGDRNYPSNVLRGMALFFCAFSIVTAFGCGLWTWFKRSTRVIQASQPFFLYLVCAGVIMVAASIIPYSMDDRTNSESACDGACTAVFWLLFPGLSIVFSALFTKTYRINLIMKNSKKFRRIKVTIRQTLTTMAVMLILNIITLSVMTAINPPIYVRDTKTTDRFGRPEDTYGYCDWNEQRIYLIALAVINLLILLLSAYQSWEARKLSTEFAESQYIFAALIITLTLFMVAAPVIIMSRSSPKTILFVYSSAIMIFCMNILLLLFVPKIRFYYKKNDDSKKSTLTLIATGYDHRSSEDIGEKILTTQSASNLSKQVHELQLLLRKQEQQEMTHLPDCNCTCKDAANPIVTTS